MKRTQISTASGFSLIELLISMLLGLLLIAGAIATYLTSKSSYDEAEQYSTLADNAHFAKLLMSDALLHAGFFGEAAAEWIDLSTAPPAPAADCGGPASFNGRGAADAYNVERYIFAATINSGGRAEADGVALNCITDGREGTDVLIIKRAIPQPLTDGERVDPVRDGVIDHPHAPLVHTIYVLSNNLVGRLFDGSEPHPSIGMGGEVYHGTAWPYLFEAYYIRDKEPDSEQRPPVLARKSLEWNGSAMVIKTEDLIEGVEDMRLQIRFDSDTNGEVDTYAKPSEMTASDWPGVGAVEVYMLVRSDTKDPGYMDNKSYHMGGDNYVTPAAGSDPDYDLREFRRLRVSTQASLRNPKLVLQR